MDTLRSIVQNATPQMSPDLAWAIIVLLSGLIVWVVVRYINRLDTILQRLDDAIESINKNLIGLTNGKEDHEKRISKLEDVNKLKRR